MALYIEGASTSWVKALEGVNLFFTSIFALEAVLKIFAFGPRYFENNLNKFDFFVVMSSGVDIALDAVV